MEQLKKAQSPMYTQVNILDNVCLYHLRGKWFCVTVLLLRLHVNPVVDLSWRRAYISNHCQVSLKFNYYLQAKQEMENF